MRTVLARSAATLAAVATLLLTACGDDDGSSASASDTSVVVTTGILGDVVSNLVGDAAEVEVLMPPNVDPHEFAPSAQQAAALRSADVVVINGGGLEAGLVDAIEGAEADGATVITALAAVETRPFGAHHDHATDHAAEDADDDHADDHADEGDADPHFFTDPARMAVVAEAIGDTLVEHLDALDTGDVRARIDAYVAELESLDREVEDILAVVPDDRRVLVTNHDVFGYFAERYDFEVLGTVIPGGSTLAEPSAADIAALADAVEAAGVPAIFAETSAPTRLSEALAAEGTDVEVVELYSESLGDVDSGAESYVGMVRTNAQRIADALDQPTSEEP